MIVHHVLMPDVNEVNAFIAVCEEKKEALLVDCGAFDPEIPKFLEENGYKLDGILITHDHWDHTQGLPEAVKYADDVPVYAYKSHIEGVATTQIKPGDQIKVGSLTGSVHLTPGHTPDGLTVAFPGHCFTGDALFAGSVGGTASRENYQTQLDAIRKHIFTLPPDTKLYTGHGPATTVAIESRYNPFFV